MPSQFQQAAEAIRAEHRAANKSVAIRCHKVTQVGDSARRIYALEITRFVTMNWSWEGARAFAGDDSASATHVAPEWSGEVVEVDEVGGRVFLRADEQRPSVGRFVLQPFDYLQSLRGLYDGDAGPAYETTLAAALSLMSGSSDPEPRRSPIGTSELDDLWRWSRSCLWGPPGTGKTWRIGEMVADALTDQDERLLVVSTTNKATDLAALSIARGLRSRSIAPERSLLHRFGSGADGERFASENLEHLLDDDFRDLRKRLGQLKRKMHKATEAEERAQLRDEAQRLRNELARAREAIPKAEGRVIVTTSFLALRGLTWEETAQTIQSGTPPFTTILIDEAGLVSRAAAAALSLWASRRVILVGDPQQLSPISQISRVLEPSRARWLASSGLTGIQRHTPGVHLLTKQYRMHPQIRNVVSRFVYDGVLTDAANVSQRTTVLDATLAAGPRAIWYVLDEDAGSIPKIRADRGPGGRSWVRSRSVEIVERMFRAHPSLRQASGLFVTPFVAQARALAAWFASQETTNWQASTTHAQQGSQAEVVIFDTVNASSTAWGYNEWQRLINVGMSRAQELLVVLASRQEMNEPYLRTLKTLLAPRVLRGSGGRLVWQPVQVDGENDSSAMGVRMRERDPTRLGAQIELRKAMRPVLSAEQQRLCMLPIDGKPRLVRGVAGSGKTAVMAHWLARWVANDNPSAKKSPPVWVVYANRALLGLIQTTVDEAWDELARDSLFPWDRVEIFHVLDLLHLLERRAGIRSPRGNAGCEFEARAKTLLATEVSPCCTAMFIDEAQDFGETTLALLTQLVIPHDEVDPRHRSVNIFYDNAQNVYGRGTPRWAGLGLDMLGRSTVMKESYRSTQPVMEFALNVLYRLRPPDTDPDHAELIQRQLIHQEQRANRVWWRVRFTDIQGPAPDFRRFQDRDTELRALVAQVRSWIKTDGVRPADICVIVNAKQPRARTLNALRRALSGPDVSVEERSRDKMAVDDNVLRVTTAHSFKGHDAEIVAVACADRFVAKMNEQDEVLASPFYVALTRGRSLLYVSATQAPAGTPSARLVAVLQSVFEDQCTNTPDSAGCTTQEEFLELLQRIGPTHQDWLRDLERRFGLIVGPILGKDGSIVAEPLFSCRTAFGLRAFFETTPSRVVMQALEDLQVGLLRPGEAV